MIRRLSLQNWRNYADVTVHFQPGTTFVVAVNGIGKTSLVEAARWALFGHITAAGTAVRTGTDKANAAVELELPSQRILGISRDLVVRKTSRTPTPEPKATLDGAPISVSQLADLIVDEYGTEPAFLGNVTMPAVDAASARPNNLGLEDHLGRYYGVHGLRQAADVLIPHKAAITRQIGAIKTTHATSANRLIELLDRVQQAADGVTQTEADHAQARAALAAEQQQRAQAAARHAWQDQARSHADSLSQLGTEVAALSDPTSKAGKRGSRGKVAQPNLFTSVGDGQAPAQPGTLDELTETLAVALDAERAAISRADVRLAVISHSLETLASNRARLDAAHDDCPVCRRPLDDATTLAAGAASAHDANVLESERSKVEADRSIHLARLDALNNLHARTRQVAPLPPQPAEPAADDDATASDPDERTRTEQAALESLIQARTRLAAAERDLSDAQEADAAMRELQTLFDRQARVTIALDSTEKTLRDLLDEAVRPMASAVNERWTTLFPDRGPLRTAADGTVTRTVNQHELPFDSFSAGEGAGLTLLIRLVVASMATNANFCWFDEPLEHMDPDTRRHVASMLTRAGSGEGPLRQIVLTTYEEPLARQLQARDPGRVHLIDVRQTQYSA